MSGTEATHVGVLYLTELRRAGVQHAKFDELGRITEVVMFAWEEPAPQPKPRDHEPTNEELRLEAEARTKAVREEQDRDLYGA